MGTKVKPTTAGGGGGGTCFGPNGKQETSLEEMNRLGVCLILPGVRFPGALGSEGARIV